ncbi:MAG: protein kinase [Anaerolineaceae bacterium]
MADLIGKTLKNRYKVVESLGRGGMADVYKVWDEERAVYLAMKVLRQDLAQDPIFLRRFQREAKALAGLQHPHIVRFYGLERDDLLAFLLMEYVDGISLQGEILRSEGKPLPMEHIQKVMEAVCSALHYAHHQGLVHCDIKPGNILIDKHGQVYLTDFGIARGLDAATSTMVGIGTPAYMAPELIRGEDPTPQTDIYALGIVLYEMFTGGERPFTGERAEITGTTAEKVRWEQLELNPPTPCKYNKNISETVERIVLCCLEKNPCNRYQNPMSLLKELHHAFSKLNNDDENNVSYVPWVQNEKLQKRSRKQFFKDSKHNHRWLTSVIIFLLLIISFQLLRSELIVSKDSENETSPDIIEKNTTLVPDNLPQITMTPQQENKEEFEPISIDNLNRLVRNNEIQFPEELKEKTIDFTFYNPLSSELLGKFWDNEFNNYKYLQISVKPNLTYEITDQEEYRMMSADHEFAARIVQSNNSIEVFDYADNKIILQTAGITSQIESIALSPDGKYLAIGCKDGRVLMWDVQRDEYIDAEMQHKITHYMDYFSYSHRKTHVPIGIVSALAFSTDGQYLISGGNDKIINIWEVPSGKLIFSFNEFEEGVQNLIVSQDDKYLISAGLDGIISIWNFQNRNLLSQCNNYDSTKGLMKISNDIVMYSGYLDTVEEASKDKGKIILAEIPTCHVLYTFAANDYSNIFVSNDRKTLILISNDSIDFYSIPQK